MYANVCTLKLAISYIYLKKLVKEEKLYETD